MSAYPETRNCDVMSPWHNKFPKYMSFAFPKGSPYRTIFNGAIFKLYETGVINLLLSQWQESTPNCFSQVAAADAHPIGMTPV
jgi:ABC-type amino acid transport substrate-binding protein